MKTVLSSHSEVCHVWAAQTQPEGRASRVRFEGAKLFSYETVIAEFIKDRDGQTVAVFDGASFSISTSKHQSYARKAARHMPCAFVYRGSYRQTSVAPNLTDVDSLLKKAIESLSGAKVGPKAKRPDKVEHAERRIADARALAHRFKLGRFKMPKELSAAAIAKARQIAEEERAAALVKFNSPKEVAKREAQAQAREEADAEARRIREIAQATRDAENAVNIKKWVAGETVHAPYTSKIHLRLKDDEGRQIVETSHGARVPLGEALKLFRLCQSCRKEARPLLFSGVQTVRVGHYYLSEITNEGNAKVGCHALAFAEMDRIFLSLSPSQILTASPL